MLVLRAQLPEDSFLEEYIRQMAEDPELVVLDEVLEDEDLLERAAGVFPKLFVGRHRLPVEVTLRSALWKTRYGLSYREMAHDLEVHPV